MSTMRSRLPLIFRIPDAPVRRPITTTNIARSSPTINEKIFSRTEIPHVNRGGSPAIVDEYHGPLDGIMKQLASIGVTVQENTRISRVNQGIMNDVGRRGDCTNHMVDN
jgi:hypothetical protein